MYLTIYDCVSKGEVDKLLDLRSQIHLNNNGELLALKIDGEFHDAEKAVYQIIKRNSNILFENYTVGAIFVVPKNKNSGVIVYMSKQ